MTVWNVPFIYGCKPVMAQIRRLALLLPTVMLVMILRSPVDAGQLTTNEKPSGRRQGSFDASIYNGQWWLSASKDRRSEFIAGFCDCAISDNSQDKLGSVSWHILEPMVTEIYEQHGSDLKTPVTSVLMDVRFQNKFRTAKGGERYPAKHGVFDGEYWRQMLPEERLGFIEGYIVCQKKYGKPEAVFSQAAEWYSSKISQWYGIKPNEPGEINGKRNTIAIADVLYRFKNDR